MREMPDKAFDLAIVDPPYGIGVTKINFGGRSVLNDCVDGKAWDDSTPDEKYFTELIRVSANQIVWGANYFNFFPGLGGAIIWNKNQPMPNSSQCEIASYSGLKKVGYYFQTWTNYVNTKQTEHPTEKPVALYKWLLTNYAKQGQAILDTHLGSGSSRIAAYDLGFDFTGYELDKDYFDAQEERFANHIAQPKLFAPVPEIVTQEAMFA